jgi:hypothetical protein
MRNKSPLRILLVVFLCSLSAQAETHFGIQRRLRVIGAETGRSYTISGSDGYSLKVVEQGAHQTKIHLFDRAGKKRPGAFKIANSQLEAVLGTTIQAALAQAKDGPKIECQNCDLDKSNDRSDETTEPVRAQCDLYDKFRSNGVPQAPLKQAMSFYFRNKTKFARNERYISIADYSQHSSRNRFYLLDMQTGQTIATQVSHGGGDGRGDPNHDGYLDRCTHPNGSRKNMTRAGFFRMSGFYKSSKDWPAVSGRNNGLRMEGLSTPNRNALSDAVVMHEAHYNRSGAVMGRSWGCPAFVPGKGASVMRKISGGSLFYSYTPACANDMRQVLEQVPGWQNYCSTK